MGNVLNDKLPNVLLLDKYRTLRASFECARFAFGDGHPQQPVSFTDLRNAQAPKDHDTEPCSIHRAADSHRETLRSSQRESFDGDGQSHHTYRRAKKC